MLRRIKQLALQRLEPATQHVRLGCAELTTETVKSGAVSGNQIDLNGFSNTPRFRWIMMRCHEQ